jgi:hypothetical protein
MIALLSGAKSFAESEKRMRWEGVAKLDEKGLLELSLKPFDPSKPLQGEASTWARDLLVERHSGKSLKFLPELVLVANSRDLTRK